MEDQTRENFTYFRINLTSVQGRITMSFLLSTLFTLIYIGVINNFWQSIDNDKDTLINQTKPIAFQSIQLLNLIKVTQTNLSQYLYLGDDSLEKVNKELWLIDIPRQKDTLRNQVNILDDRAINNTFIIINKQLGDLKQQQRLLERTLSTTRSQRLVRYQYKNDVLFVYQEIEKSFQELIDKIRQKEKNIHREISSKNVYFYRTFIFIFLLGQVLIYAAGVRLLIEVFRWVRQIRRKLSSLSQGNIPEELPMVNNEFRGVHYRTNLLIAQAEQMKHYSDEIAQGNFKAPIALYEDDSVLGRSLTQMRQNLEHLSEEEQKRNWSSEGINTFGDILRDNSQDIDVLCKNLISQLVKYLDVIQGGIFITQVDEYGNAFLELRGAYAYGKEKIINKKVTTYDGLIGRVYQEKEMVLISELPEDYTQISSGIGGTEPRSLLILPLLTDDNQVKGVIELASLENIEEYKVDFVKKLSNNITATITVIQSTRENQRILEESSRMYSESYLQEIRMNEGIRQKNLTKDELYGMIRQSQYRNQKQGTLLDSLADGVILVNQKLNVEVFNRGAEQIFQYRKNEIIGRPIHLILPNEFGSQEYNTVLNFEDGVYGVSAIRRNTIAHKKEGDQFPVYLSITEMRFNEDRYFVILAREI